VLFYSIRKWNTNCYKYSATKKIGETTSSDSDIPDHFHREGDEDNNPETPQFDPIEEPMPEADDYDHEAFNK